MTTTQSMPAKPRSGAGKWRTLLMVWGPTLLFNGLLPYLTYAYLTGHGASEVQGLLVIAAWPVVELLLYYLLHRRLDEFGAMILLMFLLTALSAVAYNSSRLLLLKESALTVLLGTAFLVSLLLPRPLMFWFGRKFATDGTPESLAWWNSLWRYPGFRHTQRVLTVLWGLSFVGQGVLLGALTAVVSTKTMVGLNSTVPYICIGLMVLFTVVYSRRSAARGAARAAAETASPATALPAQQS
jgi:intracellular septation protein A